MPRDRRTRKDLLRELETAQGHINAQASTIREFHNKAIAGDRPQTTGMSVLRDQAVQQLRFYGMEDAPQIVGEAIGVGFSTAELVKITLASIVGDGRAQIAGVAVLPMGVAKALCIGLTDTLKAYERQRGTIGLSPELMLDPAHGAQVSAVLARARETFQPVA